MSILFTRRRFFEATRSPAPAVLSHAQLFPAILITDSTAPSVPQNVTATAASSSQINVSWNASTDTGGSGLQGYRIYRNGSNQALTSTASTSYSDTGLTASTQYTYRVTAYDNQGNESALSSQASATTAGTGSVTASVVGGVLTIDTGLGGTARLYESWPKLENNSLGSTQYASRSIRFYLGTEDGNWNILNGWDSYDSGIDYPTEARFNGLANGQQYAFRYAWVNDMLVEGAKSALKTITASVYTAPTRNYTNRHITGTQTISSGGDWIVDNDFTGTITIAASGVFLNLNGKTITHTGSNHGIVINSNATNFECDGTGSSILHTGSGRGCAFAWASATSPAGVNIYGDLDNGSPLVVNLNSDPGQIFGRTPVGDNWLDLNGARIHGFRLQCSPNNSGSINTLASAFRFVRNGKVYDFDGTVQNAGRDGVFAVIADMDVWSCDVDLQSGTNIVFATNYEAGGGNLFHDLTVRLSGTADHSRIFHFDRETGNRLVNVRLIVTANPSQISQGVSMRGPLDDGSAPWIEVSRMRVTGGSSGAFYVLRGGGDEPGGQFWGSMHYHNCDIPNAVALGLYGGWTANLITRNNRFLQQTVEVGGPGGTWHSSGDTWLKSGTCVTRAGLTGVGSGWFSHNSYSLSQVSGSTSGISIVSSRTGYDPSTETPATGATPTTVSGVA